MSDHENVATLTKERNMWKADSAACLQQWQTELAAMHAVNARHLEAIRVLTTERDEARIEAARREAAILDEIRSFACEVCFPDDLAEAGHVIHGGSAEARHFVEMWKLLWGDDYFGGESLADDVKCGE